MYENQPHVQPALLNKDKTESKEYRIPQPPTKPGGLKHAYAIFESKFIRCFDFFFLLLVAILILTHRIPQDRRKPKHRYAEQGGTKNRPRTVPSMKREEKSHSR